MTSFEAYRTTAELTENTLEIRRVGIMAKASAAHVSVPLNAVAATQMTAANAVTNGTLQIVLVGGGAPGKPQPTDPYTIVFRKKQAAGIDQLNAFLNEWASYNAANPAQTVEVERVVSKLQGAADRALERKEALGVSFEGIKLANGRVDHADGGGPVAGATAIVDTEGEIRRQITVSRILLTGVFALRWRKKVDNRELYLLVNGVGWAIAVPVPPKKGGEARAFAAQINAAGSASQPTAAAVEPSEPSPVDQIERLAGLRDRGILSEDEFAAKKQELLGRM